MGRKSPEIITIIASIGVLGAGVYLWCSAGDSTNSSPVVTAPLEPLAPAPDQAGTGAQISVSPQLSATPPATPARIPLAVVGTPRASIPLAGVGPRPTTRSVAPRATPRIRTATVTGPPPAAVPPSPAQVGTVPTTIPVGGQ